MKRNLKALATNIQNPKKDKKSLESIHNMQQHMMAVKLKSPPVLKDTPKDQHAALIRSYRTDATRLLRELVDLEIDILEGRHDAAFGRILSQIDELDLRRQTLVIFTSDNGGYSGVADNRPLREGKGYLYEGGIRVPLIVRWPGRVKPGTLCDTPVISTDLYPTILAAAGQASHPDSILDGESLLPLLEQKGKLERQAVYFHYPNYAWHRSNRLGGSVIEGDLKLIEWFDDGSLELYDLSKDIGESRNLAAKLPAQAARLKEKLHAWRTATGASMPTLPKK